MFWQKNSRPMWSRIIHELLGDDFCHIFHRPGSKPITFKTMWILQIMFLQWFFSHCNLYQVINYLVKKLYFQTNLFKTNKEMNNIQNVLKEVCFQEEHFTVCHEDFRWSLDNEPIKIQIYIRVITKGTENDIRLLRMFYHFILFINCKVSVYLHCKHSVKTVSCQESLRNTSCWQVLFVVVETTCIESFSLVSSFPFYNIKTELWQKNYILIILARCACVLLYSSEILVWIYSLQRQTCWNGK